MHGVAGNNLLRFRPPSLDVSKDQFSRCYAIAGRLFKPRRCDGHELAGNLDGRQRIGIAFAETTLQSCCAFPTDTCRFNRVTVSRRDGERNHSIQREVDLVNAFAGAKADRALDQRDLFRVSSKQGKGFLWQGRKQSIAPPPDVPIIDQTEVLTRRLRQLRKPLARLVRGLLGTWRGTCLDPEGPDSSEADRRRKLRSTRMIRPEFKFI